MIKSGGQGFFAADGTPQTNCMENEHYVQESYLRLFAPTNEGVISRYSLVEKHGCGEYYDPIERYPTGEAASVEGYADGMFEGDETNRAENVMVQALRRVRDRDALSEEDIAHLSQFLIFQRDRSPRAKIFHQLKQIFPNMNAEEPSNWESVIKHDAKEGHRGLQYLGWRVVENRTDVPFFTSDAPVVIYQENHPGTGIRKGFSFAGKQIFVPIDPATMLVLLDPSEFAVKAQIPSTEIPRVELRDPIEVWKVNQLQGLNAFHELFGPVGSGDQLERLIETMCSRFPDEDYIRGHRWSTDRIMQARLAGVTEAAQRPRQTTLSDADKEVIVAGKKATDALWLFSHNLSLVNGLRREEPLEDYWNFRDSIDV
jgi:hypothetical protein